MNPHLYGQFKWNRTESSEMNPHLYGQFICDKGAKNIHWEKIQSLQTQC